MSGRGRSSLPGYAIAAAGSGAVLLIRLLLDPWLGPDAPLILFLGPVFAAALVGGFGPGLAGICLAVPLADFFFIDPRFSFGGWDASDHLRVGVFVVESLAFVIVADRLQRARLKREELLEQVERERARLATTLQQLPAGVVIADAGPSRALTANRAADEILRRPMFPSRDAPEFGEWGIFRPSDGRPPAPGDRPLIRSLEKGETVVGQETAITRGDGTQGLVSVNSAPVRDGRGEIIGAVTVFHDITERRRAEEERRRLLAQAEDANRAKDEFLATLSHELRNPLNTIVGWASLLQTGKLPPAETAQGLDIIVRSARTLAQLIRDLLDVSRVVSGKLLLDVRPTDLAAVVRAAAETVRFAAEAKGVSLTTDLEVPAFPTHGDPDRLQQVVWNLVSNAVKFTPAGGSVSVRLARAGNQVGIRVSDTGQGMSREFLAHAFERFRQADTSSARVHGGLGLGLAIVRNIVELHGGTVAADSGGPGLGSTFTVTLPVQAVAAPAEARRTGPARADEPNRRAPAADLSGVRVLVVEDEADGREAIAGLLRGCGAAVATAGSAAEAIESLRRTGADVLVSDLGMPGEDGYSLIRRVRRLPADQGGQVPAAALTAYAGDRDRREALAAGYQTHVSKPVEPDELQAVVAGLAGRGRPPVVSAR